MFKQLVPALRMTLLMTIVTGLLYPGVVTGICQLVWKKQADGNLVTRGGQVIGSSLIAQNFTKPEYFHPRPSAAGNDGYDPTASSASNLGPTSQKLIDRMKASAAQFRKDNPDYIGAIPADAITASGSGLDPEISLANAEAQSSRIAKSRNVSIAAVRHIVDLHAEHRDLGFLGEPRVNVLALNLALDRQF